MSEQVRQESHEGILRGQLRSSAIHFYLKAVKYRHNSRGKGGISRS